LKLWGIAALTGLLAVNGAQAATSRKLGGSGYSGTLSCNPLTRQQQLICDPDYPESGSVSVLYDPSIVSLAPVEVPRLTAGPAATLPPPTLFPALVAGPGYDVNAQIEVIDDGVRRLMPLQAGQTFDNNGGIIQETGYIQVFFTRTGAPGQMAPPAGFVTVDEDNPYQGVDTHALFFNYQFGVPNNVDATYTIRAEQFARHGGGDTVNPSDYLEFIDDATGDHVFLNPGELRAAQVRGPLVPVPEPASIALLSTAGFLLLGRRRRA
jgi:hypothetical protein